MDQGNRGGHLSKLCAATRKANQHRKLLQAARSARRSHQRSRKLYKQRAKIETAFPNHPGCGKTYDNYNIDTIPRTLFNGMHRCCSRWQHELAGDGEGAQVMSGLSWGTAAPWTDHIFGSAADRLKGRAAPGLPSQGDNNTSKKND